MTTQVALGNTSFHWEKGLLVVITRRGPLVATSDDLKEQVGVAVVVGQIADLIDEQQLGLAYTRSRC